MLEEFTRQQRTKREMTQAYVASKLGISRPTYIQIEQGARELTVTEAKKLAVIFDMLLADFLAGREPQYKVTLEKGSPDKSGGLHVRVTKKNLEKFKQVFLYVLHEVGGKPNVGEAVLHKLLYFIDFDYYEKYEENLMGATYVKSRHGPVAVELHPIIGDMREQGEIEPLRSRRFEHGQKKYLPLEHPRLDALSAREIKHIDDVLARLSDKNAKEMENYSREDIPWKSAQDGKPLSYESVFYRDERYSLRNYDDEI